jgi:hypothetical protein
MKNIKTLIILCTFVPLINHSFSQDTINAKSKIQWVHTIYGELLGYSGVFYNVSYDLTLILKEKGLMDKK